MNEAIKQMSDGIALDLLISAGTKQTSVHGYNPWRRRIEVRLSERAEKGRANEQLISFLAGIFNVNSRNIQIVSGLTSSKKTVKIIGLEMSDILKVLNKR